MIILSVQPEDNKWLIPNDSLSIVISEPKVNVQN